MAPSSEDDVLATETTGLLIPSANSTELPTVSNSKGKTLPLASSYDDVRESVAMELQALNQSKNMHEPPTRSDLNRRPAFTMLLIGCILSVALVAYPHFHHHGSSDETNGSPGRPIPFSRQDPVHDLQLLEFNRPKETGPPAKLFLNHAVSSSTQKRTTLPTNAWYQNMLLLRGEPSSIHRVYASPYMLDVVGMIPGLQAHPNHIDSSKFVMQLSYDALSGLTLGATGDAANGNPTSDKDSHRYSILTTTKLGLTIGWDALGMSSSLVRGMPYTTMVYNNTSAMAEDGRTILPTVASPIALGASPIADGENKIKCSAGGSSPTKTLVKKDLELYFGRNDFSWAVFFSEPVWVQCISGDYSEPTFLQVVGRADEESDRPLIIRSALLDDCTNGKNQMTCRQGLGHRLATEPSKEVLSTLLRRHANVYPGRNTSVQYIIDDDKREAQLILNWDAQTMSTPDSATTEKAARRLGEATAADLIMFALPHHLDKLDTSVLPESTLYCTSTLNGPTCLVKGATWTIVEDLPDVDFRAPRPPRPDFIPALASALKDDINYTLPDFFQRGAGDTYFSGKMVAKLGRILLVAEEVGDLCRVNKHRARVDEYAAICSNITLPSKDEFSVALDRLRSGVEIWINGTAETPFVYDVAWGGVVSCGCKFDGGKCENKAPDCPAFEDQGLNFGNAFYNDQHFHYGYHIYAAAVVAHFDPKWAKEHFEQVLLLVRNIANPSEEDAAFPLFRHKDWYQGSSWASGVPRPPYLNGKNQESTSEAIAAYEAVALYGRAMTSVWKSAGDEEKVAVSNEIRRVGQLMTATELRSTKRYWHVMQKDESKRIYPEIYDANVIGILWSSMAQFGTWFGPAPYLPYGIQLLPLTPISEERDDLAWANEMYYPFSKACSADFQCTGTGWVVLQLAILATVGHSEVAAGRVEQVPSEAYDDGGGNGHSKSNTLWYIATRPEVANPVPLDDSDLRGSDEHRPAPVFKLIDCHSPKLCTDDMLDKSAGQYTCRERISYLIDSMGKSQWAACAQVSGLEYPGACGQCNPNLAEEEGEESTTKNEQPEQCPPCTQTECESDLNRCPVWDRTFVCSAGSNTGGCSGDPWEVDNVQCNACCELTKCHKLRNPEAKKTIKNIVAATCPPCEKSICYGELNQCPIHAAPYLCTAGTGVGGCSQKPWVISDVSACTECCEVTTDC